MIALRFIDTLTGVESGAWNAVLQSDYPFLRYEFLRALEDSGATTKDSGWQPHHLLVEDDGELVGHLPLYLKFHSYGEYVFDWAWADAYRRNGLPYYPKLLAAIPYTPATGPRLSLGAAVDSPVLRRQVADFLIAEASVSASSLHVLFPRAAEDEYWDGAGLLSRTAPQYHWFNRDFASFGDFLATFNSRKRKSLRRERRLVAEQKITLRRVRGEDITPELWRHFYYCYQITYAKRSGHGGYLNQAFFERLGQAMPEKLLLVVAEREGRPVAAALNFYDSQTLYGRYWGCVQELECLHFETCYYQGIEFCIEQGLHRFDPGAQGEHKIQRGFEPIITRSRHWIVDERFREAIARFLDEERIAIDHYLEDAREMLPFRQSNT